MLNSSLHSNQNDENSENELGAAETSEDEVAGSEEDADDFDLNELDLENEPSENKEDNLDELDLEIEDEDFANVWIKLTSGVSSQTVLKIPNAFFESDSEEIEDIPSEIYLSRYFLENLANCSNPMRWFAWLFWYI